LVPGSWSCLRSVRVGFSVRRFELYAFLEKDSWQFLTTHRLGEIDNFSTYCGKSYDDAMLRFHEGHEIADPNLDAKKGWRPLTPGLRKWSEQMSTEDLRRFEAAAGDLLDELGYPRAVPDPPQETLAWTARIRESFTWDVPSSGDRLPVGWTT